MSTSTTADLHDEDNRWSLNDKFAQLFSDLNKHTSPEDLWCIEEDLYSTRMELADDQCQNVELKKKGQGPEYIRESTHKMMQPYDTPMLRPVLPVQTVQQSQTRVLPSNMSTSTTSAFRGIVQQSHRTVLPLTNMPTSTDTLSEEEDIRWSIIYEIAVLVDESIELSFPDLPGLDDEVPKVFVCSNKEYGDYQMRNVLSIWPKLRSELKKDGRGPRYIGETIKNNLPANDMIEKSLVHDIGYVTFTLSGKWIAENVHKMLRDGIGTIAPILDVESVVVYYSSRDVAGEMLVDKLRSTFIQETLVRMLDFCNVDVMLSNVEIVYLSHLGGGTLESLKSTLLIKEREGEQVIFIEAEDKKTHLTVEKRDGNPGNAFIDLAALWYGLNEQKADWIVYVTPLRKMEYIDMCFTAAKLAGWIPTDENEYPRANYVGYRPCGTELTELTCGTSLLTDSYCDVNYTLLKNHRLAAYTFHIDEMLDEMRKDEANTVAYLLKTHARIRSITMKSRKDVYKLKASELILDKDEERELGLHILRFTQAIRQSCEAVLPDILCEYLYCLSKKFTACEAGFVGESQLWLCEATAVVMEKCFHLLGISPIIGDHLD